MKSVKIWMVLMAFLTFGVISAQKKYMVPNEAPQQIKTYVSTHFPDGKIAYVKKKEKLHYTKYKVKLDNRVELEFDGDFKVYEIESKSALPSSVIPKKVQQYVSKNYPNETIREWGLKKNSQKIELSNDVDLVFDLDGNFVKID